MFKSYSKYLGIFTLLFFLGACGKVGLMGVAQEKTASSEAVPAEMIGPGTLKPTIYYFVTINEDEKGCDSNMKRTLFGAGGMRLMRICPRTSKMCAMQGSCAITQNGKTRVFNIIGRFKGQERYFEIPEEGCRFGYGVKSSCLDPFYTLAADLTIYKTGEVIYVPSIAGLVLPDGSLHDGYFVIRDKGRGIKGRGRFDFFTGHYSWINDKNPFKKLGLGDVKTNIPYYRVRGAMAEKVLATRSYPKLPKQAVTQ